MNDLLNEIDKLKRQIDDMRPLKKLELKQLKEYYRIGLVYSSNALEGNTLTETETKVVIEDGLTVGGKPMRDCLEALGSCDTFNFMYQIKNNPVISEADILQLHHLFYHRIDDDNAGRYRDMNVVVSGTDFKFPDPGEVPVMMRTMVENIPAMEHADHPVIAAATLHSDFVRIHPFVDGNGRVARILLNLVLLKNNYPITIIPPIRRIEYIDASRKSNKGNNTSFIKLVAEMQLEALKEYLRMFI
jgi:cell filamentation protein, protein adenylyltransferase